VLRFSFNTYSAERPIWSVGQSRSRSPPPPRRRWSPGAPSWRWRVPQPARRARIRLG